MVPADDHEMALPCASVMVIMVLLNDALTCATPDVMFFFSRRRRRAWVGCFAILYGPLRTPDGRLCRGRWSLDEPARRAGLVSGRLLLLAGDRLRRQIGIAHV